MNVTDGGSDGGAMPAGGYRIVRRNDANLADEEDATEFYPAENLTGG